MLEKNAQGLRKIFEENISTKSVAMRNTGYGCYLAYQFCLRCGWKLDAENLPEGGCAFIITIKN
jgi:sensor histidine kinase regulating citrate/malate metabolism